MSNTPYYLLVSFRSIMRKLSVCRLDSCLFFDHLLQKHIFISSAWCWIYSTFISTTAFHVHIEISHRFPAMIVFRIPSFSSFAIKWSPPQVLTRRASESPSCYFPNGVIAPTDYACNPSANVSPCCGFDMICLDNKICQSISGDNFRGTCTDQTWKSPGCPQFCTGQCWDLLFVFFFFSSFIASLSPPPNPLWVLQYTTEYLSAFLMICFLDQTVLTAPNSFPAKTLQTAILTSAVITPSTAATRD